MERERERVGLEEVGVEEVEVEVVPSLFYFIIIFIFQRRRILSVYLLADNEWMDG